MQAPSKSAIRKAGSRIRQHLQDGGSPDELDETLLIVEQHRKSFATPMASVTQQLTLLAHPVDPGAEVTNRLKRVPTIVDKLLHESKLDLSRMQDVGGCRAVMSSLDQLHQLRDAVVKHWSSEKMRVQDYVDTPRSSGYRAIHVMVLEANKTIEIQLRTPLMHRWAQLAEAFSELLDQNLKQDGDHLVQKFLLAYGKHAEAAESGQPPNLENQATIAELEHRVDSLLDQLAQLHRKDGQL